MSKRKPAENASENEPRPLEGRDILVVEDDSDTIQMIKIVLEQNGARVVQAGSVPDALVQFESERPDAIVTDIGMPGLNGYALIAEIRRLDAERGENTKALAVTAFATPKDQELALASGFNGYITKPFDPQALVQAIVDVIP